MDSFGPEAARPSYRIGANPPKECNPSALATDCRDAELIRRAGALILPRALRKEDPGPCAIPLPHGDWGDTNPCAAGRLAGNALSARENGEGHCGSPLTKCRGAIRHLDSA